MNDRVSNRPPSPYLREDDAMEHYSAHSYTFHVPRDQNVASNRSNTYHDAEIESSKPSGMYRFGRAIFNAFNPLSVWRGFGGARDGKEQAAPTEKMIMQARQVKAEREYAELKRAGFKGTQVSGPSPPAMEVPIIRCEDTSGQSRASPHRDSGVDVDGYRSSSELKPASLESKVNRGFMPPSLTPKIARVASPFSETGSARKSSIQFRKPSFQSLKKVKSHVQLPSAKRPAVPSVDSSFDYDKLKSTSAIDQSLRKQPSRKDIAKQQRLSKRVSDLEGQLEIARRNLKLSLKDSTMDPEISSPTGLKPFVPGALPSLPSEGVLKAYTTSENGGERNEHDTKQPCTTFSERQAAKSSSGVENEAVIPDAAAQLNQELQNSVSKQSRSKKRKSDAREEEDVFPKPSSVAEEDVELDDAKKPKLRRSMRPLQKSHRLKDTEVPDTNEMKPVPRTPHNSPLKKADPIPPLPVVLSSFDPSTVDQAKLISMRSTPDTKTSFGKHSDDIHSLRKKFPTITEVQLNEYLSSLTSEDKAMTDYTSLSHQNHPVPPILGRPCTASSGKGKSVQSPKSKIAETHSQPLPTLPPPVEFDPATRTNEILSNLASTTAKSQPAAEKIASSVFSKPAPGLKSNNEKPLPDIQKEKYEWPEDVF